MKKYEMKDKTKEETIKKDATQKYAMKKMQGRKVQ